LANICVCKGKQNLQNNYVLNVYTSGFVDFKTISVYFKKHKPSINGRIAHPRSHGLSHTLLESEPKSAVAPIAALAGQLLGCEGTLLSDSLAIETNKMLDA
jgi:hypothetical protein